MSPRRPSDPIADLFSKSGVKVPRKPRPTLPSAPPTEPTRAAKLGLLLPKDLAGALKRLGDADIDLLIQAVVEEARGEAVCRRHYWPMP